MAKKPAAPPKRDQARKRVAPDPTPKESPLRRFAPGLIGAGAAVATIAVALVVFTVLSIGWTPKIVYVAGAPLGSFEIAQTSGESAPAAPGPAEAAPTAAASEAPPPAERRVNAADKSTAPAEPSVANQSDAPPSPPPTNQQSRGTATPAATVAKPELTPAPPKSEPAATTAPTPVRDTAPDPAAKTEVTTPNLTAGKSPVAVAPSAPKAEIPSRIALAPVPDPALVTKSPNGALPGVVPDGRKAWQVYARPSNPDDQRPLIAVLVAGVGLSQAATRSAIQQLPGQVSLAFAAYAPNVDRWVAEARAAGHEVLLQMPMEPVNFPANDPGPHTLLTSLPAGENIGRMEFILSRSSGYVGVVSLMGARFMSSSAHMRPVMAALNERGLLFLDGEASAGSVALSLASEIGLPNAVNDRFIDRPASRAAIDAQLLELEQLARAKGATIGVGYPFPVTIERLTQWAPSLKDKGIALAPISSVVARRQAK